MNLRDALAILCSRARLQLDLYERALEIEANALPQLRRVEKAQSKKPSSNGFAIASFGTAVLSSLRYRHSSWVCFLVGLFRVRCL
jgi:hypothetical protein